MKRLVSLLLFFTTLTISIYACADTFTLRNNVHFGDTYEQVKSKEVLPIDEIYTKEDDKSSISFKGTISGYEGRVEYEFDDSNHLKNMKYEFADFQNTAELTTIYSSLKEGLTRKYGIPLGNTGGKTHAILGKAFHDIIVSMYLHVNLSGEPSNVNDYDEWLVECDGGVVKIELVRWYWGAQREYSDPFRYVVLGYHYATDEDIANLIQEKNEKMDTVDKDL